MSVVRIGILMFMAGLWSISAVYAVGSLEDGAIQRAEQFLHRLDEGQCEHTWTDTTPLFKYKIPEERWQHHCHVLRPLFGPPLYRQIKAVQHRHSLPEAPDGDYVIVVFRTTYQNKENALETVTPQLDADGNWRISGYVLR